MAGHCPASRTIRRLVTIALLGAALAAACASSALAAPSVTITKPLNGEVTNKTTPSFSGTGEPGAGTVTLRIYAGAFSVTPPETSRIRELPIGLEGATWKSGPLLALPDGVYTAQASQTNGEEGRSAPVTFTIRTTPPVVTLEQPRPAPGDFTPSFAGTASEHGEVLVLIHEGETEAGKLVATATAEEAGGGWHSGASSVALAVGRYTAVAVEESAIGNSAGRSTPMVFEVLPPAPPAPVTPGSAPGSKGVAADLQAKPLAHASLLAPFPVVRVTGVAFAGGIRLRLLSVQQLPAGALVRVRCHGHGCPPHGARRTSAAGPHGVPAIVFRSFERFLRAGAVVEVFVTKPGTLGKYTRLRVRRGRLPERVDECLDAEGVKPIACPAA